jgi:hypothetical protein
MSTVSELEGLDEQVTNVPSVDRRRKPTRAPVQQAQPLTEGGAVLSIIDRAIQNGADIDTLERLLAMQERVLAEHAKRAFVGELAEMQADFPVIEKRGFVDLGGSKKGYSFARWEDINPQILPRLREHGFALMFTVESDSDSKTVTVTGILSHKDGHREKTTFGLPFDGSGSKNIVQAAGSAISYCKRYIATAMLNLTARDGGEIDDDAVAAGTPGGELLTASEVADLERLAKDVGADIGKFCQFMRVPSLAEMPVSMFDDAKKCLEKKRARA